MSQGVISSELMLFEPKAVNEGVEYLQYIECRPSNQITEDGSVDIHIKASGSQYLDLQRSRLHVSPVSPVISVICRQNTFIDSL